MLNLHSSYLQWKPKIHLTWAIFSLRISTVPLVWGIWALSWPSYKWKDLKSSRNFYFFPSKKIIKLAFHQLPSQTLGFLYLHFGGSCFSFVCECSVGFDSRLGEMTNIKYICIHTYIDSYLLIGSLQCVSINFPWKVPHPICAISLPNTIPPVPPWDGWPTFLTGDSLSCQFPVASSFLLFVPFFSSLSLYLQLPLLNHPHPFLLFSCLSWAASSSGTGGFSTCSV